MTRAHWFTRREIDGFAIESAVFGCCDLSVLHVGGEWQWLVRHDGHDIAEGGARRLVDAREQAEEAARESFRAERESPSKFGGVQGPSRKT